MPHGKISADLDGVLQSRTLSTDASTATLDGGSSAATAAGNTEQELNDISTTLRTNFATSIESLQAQFTSFRSAVSLSDWDGATKNRALSIAERYESLLTTVSTEATSAVAQFGTQTAAEADNLRAGISEQYQGLTNQFADRYTSLGTALQNYHDGLADLDAGSLQEA